MMDFDSSQKQVTSPEVSGSCSNMSGCGQCGPGHLIRLPMNKILNSECFEMVHDWFGRFQGVFRFKAHNDQNLFLFLGSSRETYESYVAKMMKKSTTFR